jgi:protocatechuate 3,4-dioxygenase beta subunit
MGARLHLRVKDKASGGGLAGVAIRAGVRSRFHYSQLGDFETGEDGTCIIEVPEEALPTLLLTAFRDDYVPRILRWAVDHGDDVPSNYTLALEKGITIGGIVRNEQGEPVPGAKVMLQAGSSGYEASAREWSALNRDQFAVRTDGNGVWGCGFAPADLSDITIHLEHSEYAPTHCVTADRNYVHETQIVPKEALLAGSAVVVLSSGFPISGRITSPDGRPVAGATVTLNPESLGERRQSVLSGPEGRFVLPHCRIVRLRRSNYSGRDLDRFKTEDHWKAKLIVEADGLAPAIRKLSLEAPAPEFEIQLGEAAPLNGRVLDPTGQAIAAAHVTVQWQPEGEAAAGQGVGHFWRTQTDDQGNFALKSTPAGVLRGYISKAGFMARKVDLPAGPNGGPFVLEPAVRLSGTVLDAESRQPVSRFRIYLLDANNLEFVPGSGSGEVFFGKNGRYDFELTNPEIRAVRIKAQRYESQIFKLHLQGGQPVELNFLLQKQQYLEGVIVSPEGEPVAGAQVKLVNLLHPVRLEGPKLNPFGGRGTILQADDAGHFAIPRPSPSELEAERARLPASVRSSLLQALAIVAINENGFGVATEEELASSGKLMLTAWGRIEGELRSGSGSRQGQTVRLKLRNKSERPAWIHLHRERQTDARGRFEFAYLPPERYTLERVRAQQDTIVATHTREVTLAPGAVEQICLGAGGRLVIGRVEAESGQSIDGNRIVGAICERPANAPATVVQCIRMTEFRDAEGRVLERHYTDGAGDTELRHYSVLVAPDGSFRIQDVEPGEYILSFMPSHAGSGQTSAPIRTRGASKAVVVPAAVGSDDPPIDLGAILMPVA